MPGDLIRRNLEFYAGKHNQVLCVEVLKSARRLILAYMQDHSRLAGVRYICHGLKAATGAGSVVWEDRIDRMLNARVRGFGGGVGNCTVSDWLLTVDRYLEDDVRVMRSRLAWLDHLILVEEIGAPVQGPQGEDPFPGSIDFPFLDKKWELPFHLYFEQRLKELS